MNKVKNNPKVSIIVPVYRVERYLQNCVLSVMNQTYSNWELILVDDGSPDSCGQMCDDFANNDSRIKVIHKPNGGLSDARNAGLNIIRGEYISFLDSDDFWHTDYLRLMMKYAVENEAEIVQCGFVRGAEMAFPNIELNENLQFYDNHSVFIQQAAKVIMWGKMYKSYLFEGVRMPVGLINEDDWTTWKLYYKAQKIVVSNLPLYYYTQNPNSIMETKRKRPDMTYFGAYRERIAFFIEKGEQDLEDISRMQWCKSLLLLYSNPMLTEENREEIKSLFDENWKKISKSTVVPSKLKILFYGFYKISVISSITACCRRMGGGVIRRSR